MSLARALLCCLIVSPCLAGCSDAMCDPNPVGDAWKPYESLLPGNAVVCGPNRSSAKKPSDVKDDNPPTHVFVFYKDAASAGDAFNQTIQRFDEAGWKLAKMDVFGEGASAIFDATVVKGDDEIHIGVNDNDWGTQGSFDLNKGAAAAPPATP